MKKETGSQNLSQFKNYSLKNMNAIFGGIADGGNNNGGGDGDDDDTERKGVQVPTNGNQEEQEEQDGEG